MMQNDIPGPRRGLLRDILLAGILAGSLYFAADLILFYPREQLGLMGGFLRFNLFAYSYAVWVIAFIVLSAGLHVVMYPLAFSGKRGAAIAGRSVIYFVMTLTFLAGHAVWMAYADTAPMLPSYVKVQDMRAALAWAVLIAGLVGIILGFVSTRKGAHARSRGPGPARGLGLVGLACFIYVIVLNLPVDYADLGGIEDGGPYPGRIRTVVFGVDAGSWNVVLPLVRRGELPAFKRMMDEGTYGYFDTYGRQLTPPSWTSIATGKSEGKHGVHDFADLSTDWKAAPIWSIMSSAGKRVGVVNWVCTWPPFDVRGGFISKVSDPHAGNSHFSEEFAGYAPLCDSLLADWEYEEPTDDAARLERAKQEITHLERINDEVFADIDPDFAAYYYYSTDMLQHFFWLDMEPGRFRGGDWAGERSDPVYADAIKEGWLWADGFLDRLMKTYGEYANYIVVSDHGARPIYRRQVQLDMAALLEELGYLTTQDGEVRRESSVCYPAQSGSSYSVFDIDLNPAEFMHGSDSDKARYDDLRAKIAEGLRSVRLEASGDLIFQDIYLPDRSADPDAPDLRLLAARAIMVMPPGGSGLVVGGDRVEAERLLHYHPWSGRHRARGIILAKGPAIKHRYAGAWTIDDPYTRIFRYGHGIYGVMDRVSGPLRRLHLVDEVMNLDVTPTLLYLAHLPVARDMDGRVLLESIETDFKASNPVQTVDTYRMGETLDLRSDPDAEHRIKERLKALGYIQ
jgi:predicted AlkP superfamily phosphohydrolase/phosphomutase